MLLSHFKRYQEFQGTPLLSIDYGTQIVGLATFCPGRDPFPIPYGRIIYKNDDQVIRELIPIIKEEMSEVIILGLPLHTDGSESEMSKRVQKFGDLLKNQIFQKKNENLQMHYQDETLTSYEAEDRMKNSSRYNFKVDPKQIDALAASIILEDFLKGS